MSKYRGKFQPSGNCAKLGLYNDDMSTVAQLLDIIEGIARDEPEITPEQASIRISKIRKSAEFICGHIGRKQTPALTPTESLITCEAELKESVKKVKSAAMRILYFGQWKLLVEFAKAFGFQHEILNFERKWDRLGCIVDSYNRPLINHLKTQRVDPQDVAQEHLEAWKDYRENQRRSIGGIEQSISQLKYQIRKANLQSEFPRLNVNATNGERFSVPVDKMSPEVQEELTALLETFREQDQREVIRMSKRTRKNVAGEIERLYGFARDYYPPLCGRPLTSLDQLLRKPVIKAFVRWLRKTHSYSKSSLIMVVSNLRSLIKAHPVFAKRDWEWLGDLLEEFLNEPESVVDQRRQERAFDYNMDALRSIPEILRERRESAKGLSRVQKGWLIHDEFLMLFLVKYPWPPRCLRECRVTGDSPHLTKRSPGEGLPKEWYFYFHPEEVPRRRLAKGPLPKKLVPMLNLYMRYRRHLLKGKKTTTLFLNRNGDPLTQLRFTLLVCKITRSTVGRPVPPAGFRDARGYEWLANNPGDYSTLASQRWESEYWVKMHFDRDFRNKERAKWQKNKAEGRAAFASRRGRGSRSTKNANAHPKAMTFGPGSATRRLRKANKQFAA